MTTSSPLVSFVLLTYRQEAFVAEAVRGALAQDYSPLEIIISDDCSPDGTFNVIKEVVGRYQGPHRVVLNRNEQNLGIGLHSQKAVGMASGEWIVGGAGDDVSESNRVSTLIEGLARAKSVVAVCSGWSLIDSEGSALPTRIPSHIQDGRIDQIGDLRWVSRMRRAGPIGIPGTTAMWALSLFRDFPPMDPDVIAEDIVLGFRAYLTGGVVHLDKPLVRYRCHEANVCGFQKSTQEEMERAKWRFYKLRHSSLLQRATDLRHFREANGAGAVPAGVESMLAAEVFCNEIRMQWPFKGVIWRLWNTVRILARSGPRVSKWFAVRSLHSWEP